MLKIYKDQLHNFQKMYVLLFIFIKKGRKKNQNNFNTFYDIFVIFLFTKFKPIFFYYYYFFLILSNHFYFVLFLFSQAKEHAGKADDVLKGISNQLSATLEDLKSKSPELSADATKLKEKFEESLRSVLHSTEQYSAKLKEQGVEVSGQVENVLKKIYEDTQLTAQKLAADVQASVKKSN